jgi:hypothetical protein
MTAPAPVAPAVPPAAAEWIGTWSRPPDRPAQVALGLAVVLLAAAFLPGGPRWIASLFELATFADLAKRRRFLVVTSFVAAFLSLGYIAFYLRGGPRAPEAGLYWIQGRAMAHGELAWSAPEPSASFRATGLLFRVPDRLAGTLPPGFPLLLAPAFLVGAPMVIGPLLAALLVLATWLLAREMALACGEVEARAEAIARTAVGLSVLSAALRQATADAVPYGASAALVAGALALALRSRRLGEASLFAPAGLAVGLLADMQPSAALPVGAIVLALAWGSEVRPRAIGLGLLGALPAAGLWLLANRAATGHAFGSAQAVYAEGLGPGAAVHAVAREVARAAVRGLRAHMAHVANFEPLALLAIVPVLRRSSPRGPARGVVLTALAAGGVASMVLILAGAGAIPGSRTALLLAIVPLEHALVAYALATLFPRHLASAVLALGALSLAGFAVHTSNDHEAVAKAGLGRPLYEPDEAREANVTHGILFFDDDGAYELAHDPAVAASHGVQAVRMRGDDHDRLLYDLLGHPQSHRYAAAASSASVTGWVPPGGNSDSWRFEAESDYPAAASDGAFASVPAEPIACASDSHALVVTPSRAGGSVTIALPLPRGASLPERTSWTVTPRVVQRGSAGTATADLVLDPPSKPLATWTWSDLPSGTLHAPWCMDLPARTVEVGKATRAWLVVHATGGDVTLDRTTLRPR